MGKELIYEVIGQRIRKIREAQNITQIELSEQIPLSRSSVVNIEHGKHRIQLHVLYAISATLKVSIYQILVDISGDSINCAECSKYK